MKVRKLLPGIVLVTALSLSLWLAGCSSSGSAGATGGSGSSGNARGVSTPASSTPSAGSAGQSTSAISGGEISVNIKNNTFPEEIRVKAGAKVVFVIKNSGDEEHTFEIPDFNLIKKIAAGSTVRLEWTVPDSKGKWDMGCFLTDPPGVHDRMEGTLIIE